MTRADWGAATDTGLRRGHNEDSYLAGPTLFVVADGMGGHRGGEVASDIAVTVLQQLSDAPITRTDEIQAAIATAHERILAAARERPELTGMGTTVAGVASVEIGGLPHWAVFNVGDSRVYRRHGDTLTQVTVDHSEVQELVDAGLLDADGARRDSRRNVITRSLGGEQRPVADVWVFPPTPGEQFLVCSDGLTGELVDREIQSLLDAAATARDAAHLLVAAAVRSGGRDNVTVVVVETSSDEELTEADTSPPPELPELEDRIG